MKRAGFTLVELLVVVSIIVLLLAMLMPAMNRAIYTAQLAQCMATQRATVQAVMDYAHQNKREYPTRGLEGKPPNSAGVELGPMQVYNRDGYDIRPPLKGYVQINKMLQCPLVEAIDLEIKPEDQPNLHLETSYMMFWAWQYNLPEGPSLGMYRLGDYWESPEGAMKPTYNVLMSDMDLRYGHDNFGQSSHPDKEPKKMQQWVWRNFFAYGRHWNLSRWTTPGGDATRGPVDDNFAYDDGSVLRYNDVLGWNHEREPLADERMNDPRLQYDHRTPEDRFYLPSR